MAVTMTLVKGPTLQKILVLTLLTLTGLGYPPDFCEAVLCYQCGHDRYIDFDCSDRQEEVDCRDSPQGWNGGCQLSYNVHQSQGLHKSCDLDGWFGRGEEFLRCMQQELGGSGNCVRGKKSAFDNAVDICEGRRSGSEAADAPSSNTLESGQSKYSSGLNWQTAKQETAGRNRDKVVVCACRGDLCNTDALFEGTGGPPGPSPVGPAPSPPIGPVGPPGPTGTGGNGNGENNNGEDFSGVGRVLPGGRNVMQVGIIGLVVTLLATNWLFY